MSVKIELLYSPAPREVLEQALALPEGTTVSQALAHAGWLSLLSDGHPLTVLVWGRKVSPDTPVRDGDRIELCRALRVDPKVARRERFVGQGARSAGLFAKRRPGSKSGY